jgi:hypothetical protein
MFLLLGLIGVQSLTEHKRISESRAAGLAPYNGALGGWLQKGGTRQELRAGIVAGELGGNMEEDKEGNSQSADRKIVRKGTLNIFVSDPDRANQELQQMARELGGYIVTSEREDAAYGRGVLTITARVPATRFDTAWTAIRKLGVRVDSERMESSDVTKQFVDTEASLRNLHAEEAQYLGILKQAKSVKDTLEVTEHLSNVRGQIERLQGELNYLKHDVEMSSLTVSVRPDADTKVLGIYWRPLYQTKVAFRNGVEAITAYFDFMIAFIMYIPVLLMWAITVAAMGTAAYRAIRWIVKRVFSKSSTTPQTQE